MDRPNLVVILADDMGYGDPSCYNPDGKIDTPQMDRLAAEGMRFTDAHAASSVCTPSRYSLLTGRYSWRGPLQHGVLGPLEPALIGEEILTLPQFLRDQGYHTACVGKWHLGMAWPFEDPESSTRGKQWRSEEVVELTHRVDYEQPIADGPTARGFDYYFGVDVPNFPPYVFLENDHTVGLPTVPKPDSLYGVPGIMQEGWDLEAIMPTLTEKAVAYIEERAGEGRPFFLYFSLTGPHTPIVPTAEWRGKSRAGIYGDWVMQLDDTMGQIDEALQRCGLTENTLLVVTSDNGSPGRNGSCEAPGTVIETFGHNPSWILRGMKGDAWDGGHRVPFIAKWPGRVPAGTTCEELVSLMDLYATAAGMAGAALPEGAAADSVSLLPYLWAESPAEPVRDELVHHGLRGLYGMRRGDWKLIAGRGSGGFSPDPSCGVYDPPMQLYHLGEDLREEENRYTRRRDVVRDLEVLLAERRFAPAREGAPEAAW
jgi:arylsulfatase A-like enzyme